MARFPFIPLFTALLMLAAMPAHAEGGDIIIVEAAKPGAAEVQTLQPKDRTVFQRIVAQACYQRGRFQDGFKQASARTGQNAAKIYCDCLAPMTAQTITIQNVKSMFRTRQMDPDLQAALIPHVRTCLALAGYQHAPS
jgi:hypothetical protein